MNQKLNYCTQFLSESQSVAQWNQRREELHHQGMTAEVCSLESSGLIVKVLGADPIISSRMNDQYERETVKLRVNYSESSIW